MRKTITSFSVNTRGRAFTLIEVMVVAVIVVLMLGLALPVFRAITGSRSEAGAANQIAAVLSHARADAIGLQKTIGIAFIYNTSAQIEDLAEVEFPDCPAWSTQLTYPAGSYTSYVNSVSGATQYYYTSSGQLTVAAVFPASSWTLVGGPPLEIRPDTSPIPLPTGIGVQTVCNCSLSSGVGTVTRLTDGYLNFGVILFDGHGKIVSQNYGVSKLSKLATTSSLGDDYPKPSANVVNPLGSTNYGVGSQFGLVVFQREALTGQGFVPHADALYTGQTYADASEENWLDQNATPLVIDRYTGGLVKGE